MASGSSLSALCSFLAWPHFSLLYLLSLAPSGSPGFDTHIVPNHILLFQNKHKPALHEPVPTGESTVWVPTAILPISASDLAQEFLLHLWTAAIFWLVRDLCPIHNPLSNTVFSMFLFPPS